MQRRAARRTAREFARLRLLLSLAAGGLLVGSAAWAEDAADAPDDGNAKEEQEETQTKDEQVYRALTTQASEIELGFFLNHVDGEPSAFAQYRGLDDDQFYVLGNLDIFRRDPWDGESTQYYRFRGLNLGLESRSIDAEYGHQGRFGLSFLYDELPVYKTQTARTFFLDAGSANLTLPSSWVAGDRADVPFPGQVTPVPPAPYPSPFQTSIYDNLYETDIGWKRRKFGSGLSIVLPADLEFASHYSYETKKGDKLMGSTFGLGGGDPRSVIIPERIDYHTHQMDGALTLRRRASPARAGILRLGVQRRRGFPDLAEPLHGSPRLEPVSRLPGPAGRPDRGLRRRAGVRNRAAEPAARQLVQSDRRLGRLRSPLPDARDAANRVRLVDPERRFPPLLDQSDPGRPDPAAPKLPRRRDLHVDRGLRDRLAAAGEAPARHRLPVRTPRQQHASAISTSTSRTTPRTRGPWSTTRPATTCPTA